MNVISTSKNTPVCTSIHDIQAAIGCTPSGTESIIQVWLCKKEADLSTKQYSPTRNLISNDR